MLRKFCIAAIAVAATNCCFAQDSAEVKTAKPVITVSADAYYRFNFSNPKSDAGTFNNFTSFTNSHNSFELGMASVKLEHSFGKVGVVADLGFGKRADDFSYTDYSAEDNAYSQTRFAIKQLNLSYAPTENIKFTAGTWATHIGYELVDAYANRNYSMSYMFSKGPFLHTGVKSDFTIGSSGFMVGIANPTDFKTANFSRKWLVAQYSVPLAGDKLKAYVNFQGGKPGEGAKLKQYDLVLTSALTGKFGLGFNGTVSSVKRKDATSDKFGDASSWWGSALYVNVDPTPAFGLTLRGEYFKDDKQLTDVFSGATAGGSVFATTLSTNFRIDNLTIIPELRLDNASQSVFTKGSGETTKSTVSALVAAVYKF
ncbi:MAG TPA: outer membrane beta-barrel protein [Chitinophagaceae bacterium]|jgi:hypothetical protein|nr:outer membrane beta-barrel protein [Chitinophagaceae bacterium]